MNRGFGSVGHVALAAMLPMAAQAQQAAPARDNGAVSHQRQGKVAVSVASSFPSGSYTVQMPASEVSGNRHEGDAKGVRHEKSNRKASKANAQGHRGANMHRRHGEDERKTATEEEQNAKFPTQKQQRGSTRLYADEDQEMWEQRRQKHRRGGRELKAALREGDIDLDATAAEALQAPVQALKGGNALPDAIKRKVRAEIREQRLPKHLRGEMHHDHSKARNIDKGSHEYRGQRLGEQADARAAISLEEREEIETCLEQVRHTAEINAKLAEYDHAQRMGRLKEENSEQEQRQAFMDSPEADALLKHGRAVVAEHEAAEKAKRQEADAILDIQSSILHSPNSRALPLPAATTMDRNDPRLMLDFNSPAALRRYEAYREQQNKHEAPSEPLPREADTVSPPRSFDAVTVSLIRREAARLRIPADFALTCIPYDRPDALQVTKCLTEAAAAYHAAPEAAGAASGASAVISEPVRQTVEAAPVPLPVPAAPLTDSAVPEPTQTAGPMTREQTIQAVKSRFPEGMRDLVQIVRRNHKIGFDNLCSLLIPGQVYTMDELNAIAAEAKRGIVAASAPPAPVPAPAAASSNSANHGAKRPKPAPPVIPQPSAPVPEQENSGQDFSKEPQKDPQDQPGEQSRKPAPVESAGKLSRIVAAVAAGITGFLGLRSMKGSEKTEDQQITQEKPSGWSTFAKVAGVGLLAAVSVAGIGHAVSGGRWTSTEGKKNIGKWTSYVTNFAGLTKPSAGRSA